MSGALLNLWETIDHRWLLRRADDAHVPQGCPVSFGFCTNAVRWARIHGYEIDRRGRVTHNGHPHLRDDLPYPYVSNAIALDCPRALLHVEKCPCGADTVRPYEPELVEKMREEWGIACTVNQRALDYVMSLTYDPDAPGELVSAEAWLEGALA